MVFNLVDTNDNQAVIKVMGVGGGGGNAVDHMMNANIQGVEYICANTDAQVLSKMGAKNAIQLCLLYTSPSPRD